MRIQFVYAGRGTEIEVGEGGRRDMRGGKAQLGIVDGGSGTRWGEELPGDARPVPRGQPGARRQVLESPLATRMLEGVERPGRGDRAPAGATSQPVWHLASLARARRLRGTTMGMRPAMRGAPCTGCRGEGVRARRPSASTAPTATRRPSTTTWEGALTAKSSSGQAVHDLQNRDAFDALTSHQQEDPAHAGARRWRRSSTRSSMTRRTPFAACARGALTLVSASAADLAALREWYSPSTRSSRPIRTQRADRRHHRDACRGFGTPRRKALGSASAGASSKAAGREPARRLTASRRRPPHRLFEFFAVEARTRAIQPGTVTMGSGMGASG